MEMDYRQIATEAAEWLLKLEDDPHLEGSAEFVAWLKRSPRHMGEFLFATAAFKLVQSGDPQRRIAVEASSGADAGDIVALAPVCVEETKDEKRTARWRGSWRIWSAAAALAMVCAGIAAWSLLQPATDIFQTRIGEQRSFKLDDGSLLYLNTLSQARVTYSETSRDIQLVDGEALFIVAEDRHRPFRVRAGAATIQALGTQFNVYRRREATTVSVVEGRVKVSSAPSDAAADGAESPASTTNVLEAGEEALVNEDHHIAKRTVRDLAPTLAWRQRRLAFEATPLEVVAREFNRYNRLQIRLEGKATAALQITGVFNADEPHALVNFLREDPSFEVHASGDGVVIGSR